MEDGLQEFNTQVNEAKAAGEKIKEQYKSKCKELENKLLYAEVYQRWENLHFYGIEETNKDKNSLQVLQSSGAAMWSQTRHRIYFSKSMGLENPTEMEALERLLLKSLDMGTEIWFSQR